MATNPPDLPRDYNLVTLAIAPGTQISTRTAAIIETLTKPKDDTPIIICLTAKSRTVNKLISIVEIAKRELKAQGVEIFQYNALSSEMVVVERGNAGGRVDGDESDDGAFETMGVRGLEGAKKRVVPVMRVYLSATAVEELGVRYGEQR